MRSRLVTRPTSGEFEAEIVLQGLPPQRSGGYYCGFKGAHEKFPTLDFANSDEFARSATSCWRSGKFPSASGQTVTHGIISAPGFATQVGITDYQFFIQTDAAINPGNFRRRAWSTMGRPASPAINTAIFSRLGGIAGHRLFAIPANMVRRRRRFPPRSGGKGGQASGRWLRRPSCRAVTPGRSPDSPRAQASERRAGRQLWYRAARAARGRGLKTLPI